MSATLYPASCALCKQSLLRFSSLPICESCWSAVAPQSGLLCAHCGEDLGLAQASLEDPRAARAETLLCHQCENKPPEFTRAVAYGVYEGELRGLIHLMKYDGMEQLATPLASRLIEVVSALPIAADSQVMVVPVPLHRAKRRTRGFNHAERIAAALVAGLQRGGAGQAVKDRTWTLAPRVLMRQRATESQSRLSPQGRRRNLRGAFSVRAAASVRGREVLLVDDIYTTGATATACSRVLIRAGAKAVWVATVARAQREGVAMWDAGAMQTADA